MLGLFGTSVIGTDHLTGPTGDSEHKGARFARHEVVRGKPVLQDLGDDAGGKQLQFFFDETFCDPEEELQKIDGAFKNRIPMKLFFDMRAFEIGFFLIERLQITRQKTSSTGRVVRIELEVELVESTSNLTELLGAAANIANAISNPTLRRG